MTTYLSRSRIKTQICRILDDYYFMNATFAATQEQKEIYKNIEFDYRLYYVWKLIHCRLINLNMNLCKYVSVNERYFSHKT